MQFPRLPPALSLAGLLLVGCGNAYEDYVKLYLNDPDSAKFRGVSQSKRDQNVWCGEVNARNRAGGMVGFTRFLVVLPDKALRIGALPEQKLYTQFHIDGADGFDGKWSVWCQS